MTEKYRHPIKPESLKKQGSMVFAEGRDAERGKLFAWWRPAKDLQEGREIISKPINQDSVLGVGSGGNTLYDNNSVGVYRRLNRSEEKEFRRFLYE